MVDKTTEKAGQGRSRRGVIVRSAYWCCVGGIWGVIAMALLFVWLSHDLPDLEAMSTPGRDGAIIIKADNGQTLASYGASYGDWLDFQEIPDVMLRAIMAVEDRRFFQHPGVDPRGIGRALVANVRGEGGLQGGSTLTQQLAKNLFLSPDRTLKRKAQELLLAIWLEQKLSKAQIITIYLNRVYFGTGAYGIDAAARAYFGHSARTLSLAEAAMLAGLVKAPSAYAPTRSYAKATDRASQVLDALVEVDAITPEAAYRAKQTPAVLSTEAMGSGARYFTDWAAAEVRRLVGNIAEPLVAYTSIDPQAQAAAQRILGRAIESDGPARGVEEAALVALAPDGAIRALVGGTAFARSQYNRATQAQRQPGSAFKPVVYLAALEAGFSPRDIMIDEPIDIDGWSPANFDEQYRGPMSLNDAFVASINTIAAKIGQQVGPHKIVEVAQRLGIESALNPVDAITLGTEEVTLMELTGVYTVLANGGFAVEPYAILEVHTLGGELLYRATPAAPDRVVAPDHLAALTDMMRNVIAVGTGKAARIDRPAAGKTGTSQDFRDALFVGFSSSLVAGVWVGNDDGRPTKGVTGGTLPARIWSDFMIEAHVGKPVTPLLAESRRPLPSR